MKPHTFTLATLRKQILCVVPGVVISDSAKRDSSVLSQVSPAAYFVLGIWLLLIVMNPSPAYAAGPSITSLTPNSGPVGASVTIAGSGFGTTQGMSTVMFNGTKATTITSWGSGSITAVVPGAATSGNVIVTVSGRTSNGVSFTVVPPPSISSLSQTSGAIGSSITISGSNFGGSSTQAMVTFNGTVARMSSWSSSSIVAVVPNGATTGNVVVNVSGVNSNGIAFTVWPFISNISPSFGPVGTSVTITGLNFGSLQGSSTVTFNGVSSTVTSWNTTTIQMIVPSGASTGNVVVSVGGSPSNGFNFIVGGLISTIYHLLQESGLPGTLLLATQAPDDPSTFLQSQNLNGVNNFVGLGGWATSSGVPGSIPAGTTVTFSVWMKETTAVTTVHPSFTLYYVSGDNLIDFCDGTSSAALTTTITQFTFSCTTTSEVDLASSNQFWLDTFATWSGAFPKHDCFVQIYFEGTPNGNYDSKLTIPEVFPPPSISSLSISSGAVGTPVTINGSNFGSQTGNSVTFNGVIASPTNWNNTSIVAPVPNGATDGPVVVTVGGVATNGVVFTVMPGITSLNPPSAAVGTSVAVTGTSFGATQGNSTLSFNGQLIPPADWNDTTIHFTVPPGASSGPVVVTVNTSSTSKVSNSANLIVPLYIASVTPNAAAVRAPISIRGSSFGGSQGTSTVTFNGIAASPSLWSGSRIIVPVPSGASTGPLIVTVGGTGANGGTFTVYTSGNVNGTVTRASDGSAISGAEIDALLNGVTQVSTNSAGDGTYSFSNLVPGSYIFRVSASGFATTYSSSVGVIAGSSITLNATLSTPGITSLSPSSGPVGMPVTIQGSHFGPASSTSNVAFNGTLAIPTKWSDTSITVPVPVGASSGAVVVTVGGAASNSVNFTVGTGTVAGTIFRASDSSPISGASVQALQSNNAKASATTAADGTYSLPNLTPGTYDVRVSATPYGTTLIAGNAVAASSTTTVNASLSSAGTISGKVTQSGGVTAISGASVALSQGSTTMGTATADGNGNYSISTLNAGSYTAQASAAGFNTQTQNGIAITAGNTTTTNFSLATQAAITYAYDQLGRLVGVTDSTANTAIYTYDAVGNILSISNKPSTQVSIITFDPTSGPAGTTVTISGTGFSTTASQNGISFNGTSAAITSSTATQIVTTVPSGTTTGTISVTAPAGTATSSFPFTVAGNPAPTIASFTPNMGTVGTAVTVTGTNFDTTAGNDQVQINATFSTVTSVPSTITLNTTVSGPVASGRITVGTEAGSATSTQDFFVPFGTHPATDIGTTARMILGGSQTITIGTPGKIGLVLFDATAGQRTSIQTSAGTFSTCTLYLFDPYGNQLSSVGCSGATSSMNGQSLGFTGTYTIGIDPGGTTGSFNLSLNNASDISGTLTLGTPFVSTINVAGQRALYSFSGTVGEPVNVYLTNYTSMIPQGCSSSVLYTLLNPNGTTLASANLCSLPINAILPASGTYTLVFNPQGFTGSATINATTDITGTITVGTPLVSTIPIPGQAALYTFSGTAGQSLDVYLTNYTSMIPQGCSSSVLYTIVNPNSTVLTTANLCSFPINTTLPSTGTYAIFFNPQGFTGSATINTSGDITGTITIGTPIVSTINIPGQRALYSFNGTAGQSLDVYLTNFSSMIPQGCSSSVLYTIVNPNSTVLTTANLCSSPINTTLPSTGTYTLLFDPRGLTGSATINTSGDITGTLTVGTPLVSTISIPGQRASYSFSGTAGQSLDVYLTNYGSMLSGCSSSVFYTVFNSSGTSIASANLCSPPINTTLPATGTYSILFDPRGLTGSATINTSGDITGTLTVGTPLTSTINIPGQRAFYNFSGTAGQGVHLSLSNWTFVSGCSSSIFYGILNPDGSTLSSANLCSSTLGTTLPSNGTYTVFINPQGLTGSVTVSLTSP